MPEQLIAYTLSQVEKGWTWSLWDEDGGVVAAGVAPDQPSAERGLFAALAQTRAAPPAIKDERERPVAEPRLVPRRKKLQPLPARLAPPGLRQQSRF